MPSSAETRARIDDLWRRIADERQRAARAAAIATGYEENAALPPASLRPFRVRMAALHRQAEARHLASARLQTLYATRLQTWSDKADSRARRPAFITAVAGALDMNSVAVTLFGRRTEALVAVSDKTARAAHDLEFVMGEGPVADATATGGLVRATGSALRDRWPQYGPAVTELAVQAVMAVPLRPAKICLGALCVYDQRPTIRDEAAAATSHIADALTHTVLTTHNSAHEGRESTLPLFDEDDYQNVFHQAAGKVSIQRECNIHDAIDLLRARAFADGRAVEEIALGVLRDEILLS